MKIPAMVIGFATGQNLSLGFVIVALLFLADGKYVCSKLQNFDDATLIQPCVD